MSRHTRCDRCRSESPAAPLVGWSTVTTTPMTMTGGLAAKSTELCATCTQSLRNFLAPLVTKDEAAVQS